MNFRFCGFGIGVIAVGLALVSLEVRAKTEAECPILLVGGQSLLPVYDRSADDLVIYYEHDDKKIAEVMYRLRPAAGLAGEVLEVHFMGVRELSQRGQGIGRLLLQAILKRHPEVVEIEGELAQDNYAAFLRAREYGSSFLEAVKRTPAYHIRSALGFSEIVSADERRNPESGLRYVDLRVRKKD